ncbi:MAG: aminotransferase class I/II-fold pyridoxal phosphate-dependent enzyme [Candidatus Gottesmanbacteria bacterium]|nr:aminotransferase class I/II-fold pyridoxal phosphate-dependent enzyme [Candidatus Gottesmanbacteria bacterium]
MPVFFRKIISPSLSPNTESDDVWEAVRAFLKPRSWQRGSAIDEIEHWFKDYYDASAAVSFDSGRSALYAILEAFGIGLGDDVLVQAFTCVAVPNSIRWAGATPVYVDIDKRFNIDPKDLEKKITKQSKAIIVQHTFGIPAAMDAILTIARKHNLIVIEDCAHSLGATYHNRTVGSLGDAAFFSFGRDKVLSSVWGGMAIISQKSPPKADQPMAEKVKSPPAGEAGQKLRQIQEKLPYPSRIWIVQQLFHPIAFAVILPLYNLIIGKVILECLKRLGLLSKPVNDQELRGEKPLFMPRRYPNALARLLMRQLVKLKRYTIKRRRTVAYYQEVFQSRNEIIMPKSIPGGVYLRFPILVQNQEEVMMRAKRAGILLGNWYTSVIDPVQVNRENVGYIAGSCPKAEIYARHIINLPTLISEDEARRVVAMV